MISNRGVTPPSQPVTVTRGDNPPAWAGRPLASWTGIPVCVDPTVPAGTAAFDVDPEDPRHVTRVRVHDNGHFHLTDEQAARVRDHHQAMEERARRALIDYRRLVARFDGRADR